MIKSKIKTKVIPFLGISVLLLISMLCSTADVLGQHASTAAAKFEPTKENPTEYGVIVPSPNMMATASVYGSNQGYFRLMDWNNTLIDDENVNITGKDISLAYPWYFDEYTLNSKTSDGLINPWEDISWLNVSAKGVENETVNPYYASMVWNSYSMSGAGSLDIPLNSSIPLEINISIGSTGPKILKIDWKADNPITFNYLLVTPSGNVLNSQSLPILKREVGTTTWMYDWLVFNDEIIYNYLPFVAHETGTYRLILDASHTTSIAYLNLDFVSTDISDLSLNDATSIGDEEFPTIQDQWEDEVDNKWLRISGDKGDIVLLDTLLEYGDLPYFNIWIPTPNGYMATSPSGVGTEEVYFPDSGNLYVSFIDPTNGINYRAAVASRSVPIIQHEIGGNTTLAKVSRYQMKAINFSVPEDSFVVFNYTSWGKGEPEIVFQGITDELIYLDSNSMVGYSSVSEIERKTIDDMTYLYYYLPNGTYRALVKNDNIEYDGVLQLTSKYIPYKNGTIPINDLSYPDKFASTFSTETFNPSEAHYSLKNAEWLTLNITEPGQYRLNTTLYAAENPGAPLEKSPDVLYFYNKTDDAFYGFNYPNLTYFLNDSDYLLIGSYCKFTSLLINISGTGPLPHFLASEIYSPSDDTWYDIQDFDGTSGLTDNGTIDLDTDSNKFTNLWKKGRDESIDLPQIDNETQEEFFWFRIDPAGAYTTMPNITNIAIINSSISGNMSMVILKESEYEYGDYWESDNFDFLDLTTTRDETALAGSYPGYDTEARYIINSGSSEAFTVGFEEGVYKVLIIPYDWCYPGDIVVNFAVENYWDYGHYKHYNILNISANPILYGYEINRFESIYYGNSDFLTPYTWVTHFNFTENEYPFTEQGYMMLKCFGTAYQWTQLVVQSEYIANYSIYLMQDVPWRSNNPDSREVTTLVPFSENNSVYEFGVFEDEWYLLFEYENVQENETLTFHLALSQYNTTSVVMGSATPASTGGGATNLLIGGIIIGGAAAVVIGVVYVIMRKRGGRVFSKTPG